MRDRAHLCARAARWAWQTPARVLVALALVAGLDVDSAAATDGEMDAGRRVYEFYCYQCHGYAGDAKTLASTYVDPPPRDFTAPASRELSRAAMLRAITDGRPGTAMVSFKDVLDTPAIDAVVDYVRATFMTGVRRALRYHTAANGWRGHDRYRIAFPFATGEIPLDTPWENLTPEEIAGKRLYMGACVSCHDRSTVTDEGATWDTRAVSYPRRHYSHQQDRNLDGVSGATPFVRHDRAPTVANLDPEARRGEILFRDNCAFCHGADGSGRNWIGSFLEPHPRDLGGIRVATMQPRKLRATIKHGLPGTSMPAWKDLLGDGEIDAIIDYIRQAFAVDGRHQYEARLQSPRAPGRLGWQRQTPSTDAPNPSPSTTRELADR